MDYETRFTDKLRTTTRRAERSAKGSLRFTSTPPEGKPKL